MLSPEEDFPKALNNAQPFLQPASGEDATSEGLYLMTQDGSELKLQ